jgi:twitching motility protein PilT
MTFDELIVSAGTRGASDIHMRAGHPPLVRIGGALERWSSVAAISAQHLDAIASRILSPAHQEKLRTKLEVDVAWQAPGVGRVRASVFRQRGTVAISMRLIPDVVPSAEALGLPAAVMDLATENRGLVLVTGVTGSGKSTTLAALVHQVNRTRAEHVLTIEDPIEFVHESRKCVINQREVGPHTLSFANALRSALREDPDIVLVGELRDLETIRLALTAAETGHLVFGTLHTSSAAKTIDRIVDVFPAAEKEMVRAMLSESVVAVISQTLLKLKDGSGRVAAHEIMVGTPAIRNLIRENKVAQMYSMIQTGHQFGMSTLDQCMLDLVRRNVVSVGEARQYAKSPEAFAG